ncbi:MAG: hypothetical protein ACTSP1_19655 [Candidatus Freyarchaeota archaeon]
MWPNVILYGGSSMIPGMRERIDYELKKVAPKNADVTITATTDRMHRTWIGASILTTRKAFNKMWITEK